MTLAAGARLGPYEIVAPLGAGGMGEVYRARDTRLGRDVAIKVLPAVFAADPDRLRRFEQEARATAALSHPNILSVFDVGTAEGPDPAGSSGSSRAEGEESGRGAPPRDPSARLRLARNDAQEEQIERRTVPFIVTELLEGESLRQRLGGGALPCRKAVEIATQVAHGLAAAHARGIVHRDLKPENVFITTDGAVKILDFGLATLAAAPDGTDLSALPTATAPHAVLGTAAYMSPEQARGQAVDARSDLFALGVVLYEMLSGRSPFRRSTLAETASAVLREDPPPLLAGVPACPPPLDTVVRRCLEKRPEERFSSAHDLAIALEASSWPQPVTAGTAPAQGAAGRRHRRALVAAAAVAAVALVAAAGHVLTRGSRGRGGGTGTKLMLAVLPMEDLSGDPRQEYFSDGLTEELIAQLGRVEPRRLGVIARTSAMHYKHTTKNVDEIGRELGVQYILEGSVRRDGSRVRITAQLIQVRDQTHLWADSFERDQAAVFAVQAEVAERVARSLAIELLPERREALSRGGTASPDAHEAYLRGLFLWNKRGRANLEGAAEEFRKAVDLDPSFAPARVGLADAYVGLYSDGWMPLATALPFAEHAVKQALELDPESAEAHATRAVVREYFYWDWPETERELRRALELDPGSVKANFSLGHFRRLAGRYEEAIASLREAVRLDPASSRVNGALGWALAIAGRYDEARVVLENAIRLVPDVGTSYIFLARSLEAQGRWSEAGAAFRRASGLYSGGYRTLYQAYGLALEGRSREARELLATIDFENGDEYVSPAEAAPVLVAAGDLEGALTLAERAVATRDGEALTMAFSRSFDPLRPDPRFQALLRRMNLPVR